MLKGTRQYSSLHSKDPNCRPIDACHMSGDAGHVTSPQRVDNNSVAAVGRLLLTTPPGAKLVLFEAHIGVTCLLTSLCILHCTLLC